MKNSSRSQKKKVDFREQGKGENNAQNGVCYRQQVSVHEMWKRQQVHDDVRKMYRTEIFGQEFGKMG